MWKWTLKTFLYLFLLFIFLNTFFLLYQNYEILLDTVSIWFASSIERWCLNLLMFFEIFKKNYFINYYCENHYWAPVLISVVWDIINVKGKYDLRRGVHVFFKLEPRTYNILESIAKRTRKSIDCNSKN